VSSVLAMPKEHGKHRHFYSTTFNMLLGPQTQPYIWRRLDMVRMAKWSQQTFCCWWQNRQYQNCIMRNFWPLENIWPIFACYLLVRV